jgi:hypothetical protein
MHRQRGSLPDNLQGYANQYRPLSCYATYKNFIDLHLIILLEPPIQPDSEESPDNSDASPLRNRMASHPLRQNVRDLGNEEPALSRTLVDESGWPIPFSQFEILPWTDQGLNFNRFWQIPDLKVIHREIRCVHWQSNRPSPNEYFRFAPQRHISSEIHGGAISWVHFRLSTNLSVANEIAKDGSSWKIDSFGRSIAIKLALCSIGSLSVAYQLIKTRPRAGLFPLLLSGKYETIPGFRSNHVNRRKILQIPERSFWIANSAYEESIGSIIPQTVISRDSFRTTPAKAWIGASHRIGERIRMSDHSWRPELYCGHPKWQPTWDVLHHFMVHLRASYIFTSENSAEQRE